jgi:hypothetical protein
VHLLAVLSISRYQTYQVFPYSSILSKIIAKNDEFQAKIANTYPLIRHTLYGNINNNERQTA